MTILEQIKDAEQDLADAVDVLNKSTVEVQEAIAWKEKCLRRVQDRKRFLLWLKKPQDMLELKKIEVQCDCTKYVHPYAHRIGWTQDMKEEAYEANSK